MNEMANIIIQTVVFVKTRMERELNWPEDPVVQDNWWEGKQVGKNLVWEGSTAGNCWGAFCKKYTNFRLFLDHTYNFALDHSLQTGIQVRAELMRLYPEHYTPEELSTCPVKTHD